MAKWVKWAGRYPLLGAGCSDWPLKEDAHLPTTVEVTMILAKSMFHCCYYLISTGWWKEIGRNTKKRFVFNPVGRPGPHVCFGQKRFSYMFLATWNRKYRASFLIQVSTTKAFVQVSICHPCSLLQQAHVHIPMKGLALKVYHKTTAPGTHLRACNRI